MYLLTYFFVFVLFKILHRLKIYGKENVPKNSAFIIVSNHASYYDPPILAATTYPHKIRFMAKKELFKNPLMDFFFKRCGAFPVDREKLDRKSLLKAIQLLEDRQIVGVFPEGTRVKSKEERQVFRGAAYLAFKSGAVVLPVGIKGTDKIMQGRKVIPRLAPVRLNIGKPLRFEGTKCEIAAFSDKIVEEIDKLVARDQTSDVRRQV